MLNFVIFATMYLRNLSLVNFKNYAELEIGFSSGINCFTGNNGVGKTNLLDAIYYLSFCKSYFTSTDALNIKHGSPLFVIQGEYLFNGLTESIYCGYEEGKKKKFKRNKKEYEKLADHIGLIPLVMVTPSDINLIQGGSEERRKFIDGIISQFDREYLYDLQRYNRALAQRNYLLRESAKSGFLDDDVLDLYSDQMIETGHRIYSKRITFIQEIIPVFQKYFSFISNGHEEVKLDYASLLRETDFGKLLEVHREKDKIARYSTVGIHKDDLELLLGDYPMRKLGSQGQQKTYLVALKLAQFEYMNRVCGIKPILLLDDVFDKLDSSRVERIISLVAHNGFGQIFITDTNSLRIKEILSQLSGEYFHYHVTDSALTRIYEED